MKIIKEIEEKYGYRIVAIDEPKGQRKVTEDDSRIIKSHNFEVIVDQVTEQGNELVIRCKTCFAEANCTIIAEKIWKIWVFFDKNKQEIEYGTCEQILMNMACE